ncbi:MAG TPA: DedA family protein [Vicinamibacterales bacterium]|nr:DedA family protein [Vicinamibacterales bacterium]
MDTLINYFLHLDRHLAEFVALYGPWIYALLFVIIFAETGFVVTPFLPGDSLLFAAGAMAAAGALDITLLIALLCTAAILGDAVNYSTGRFVGPRVFRADVPQGFWGRALNREHLNRAHDFFERYGGKAIVIARFAPIIRTFVPFVAGAVSMTYSKFAFYNVMGGILWVLVCAGGGYLFGEIPVVKQNFSLVAIAIVVVSLIPMAVEVMRHWRTAPPAA